MSRGRRRNGVKVLSTLFFVVLAAFAVGGWYYADQIVQPHGNRPLETGVAVLARDDSTITLRGRHAMLASVWYLSWGGGTGIVTDALAMDTSGTRRRFRLLSGRPPGATVDLQSYPDPGDPLHVCGLAYHGVSVSGPLGPLPTLQVDGTRDEWMIAVHGMGYGHGVSLRLLPVFAKAGLPILLPAYRNDAGAPRSPDGLYHLGATEWQDIDAAVTYARVHGARRVILYGTSMGGAIVADLVRRSRDRAAIAGVVLDSPALDWDAAVRAAATRRHVPGALTEFAKVLVTMRTGFNWDGPDGRIEPSTFTMPVFLMHGTGDDVVPIATSEQLASARPDLVTFVKVEGAGHVQSWNYEPARCESALAEWVARRIAVAPRPKTAFPARPRY